MRDIPIVPALVRGAAELEATDRGVRPHRLPRAVRERFPDPQLLMVEAQPSGVRVAFITDSDAVELVVHATRVAYRGVDRPRGAVDLTVDGVPVASSQLTGGDRIETDLSTGVNEFIPGPAHVATFDGLGSGEKTVELWLPHNESVELVALRSAAPVRPRAAGRLWLHHGSSISHGSNAATPTQIWPAVASRLGGVELQNLGFGGSALVDPFTARVMRDSPADLISVKLGINVVNLDGMRLRTFVPAVHGFLDTIRDGHPTTPLLVVSPILAPIHEDTPGPGAVDPASLGGGQVAFTATGTPGDTALGRLTLRVIREALARVVEDRRRDDPNLHYLDGTELYGEADAAVHPLPDRLHPDTVTHRLIGERVAEHAFGPAGPFAAR
ncbi:GDSL-like lipase/acylhydrolase family protein [Diaminobutyricimonas aerilata]|uniref:GDSL-like lipase/acylhydrolase family protein n=1 Tax=Diaminobutyricimonas aerilata TaxID=1162967 RepID=A0A2M9CFI5_9MICO|nr:SGNH/GDSL hydrolase family protein [Diaminobutyricimonas aerilata]PJJ70610.1 GDSL-like lipase/acylhydrolase family protein [Diaminobutyricimonas aerilata]